MNTAKPWYLSLTIWSQVVTVLVSIASAAHIEITPDIQAQLVPMFIAGATLVSGLVGLWGRYRSSATLTATPAQALAINAASASVVAANPTLPAEAVTAIALKSSKDAS